MVRIWSEDNPKAGLMARKRAQIVEAARQAFFDEGYAGSSVNRIAAAAGVSIKTLYRHFENKDDLFSAVIEAACRSSPDHRDGAPQWSELPPQEGIPLAGEEYLLHTLAPEQLSLHRVVIHDAPRFPELGARYEADIVGPRVSAFAEYLVRWSRALDWPLRDGREAAVVFGGLLDAGTLGAALHGRRPLDGEDAAHRARRAAERLLALIRAGLV